MCGVQGGTVDAQCMRQGQGEQRGHERGNDEKGQGGSGRKKKCEEYERKSSM